jgi:hypothetical protein
MFIVEMLTTTGKVCENYANYEEARGRVDSFPGESLVGLALIFEELPDGSQRVVRDDGKPLQWHRLLTDEVVDEEPIKPCEDDLGLFDAEGKLRGTVRFVSEADEGETDETIPVREE